MGGVFSNLNVNVSSPSQRPGLLRIVTSTVLCATRRPFSNSKSVAANVTTSVMVS